MGEEVEVAVQTLRKFGYKCAEERGLTRDDETMRCSKGDVDVVFRRGVPRPGTRSVWVGRRGSVPKIIHSGIICAFQGPFEARPEIGTHHGDHLKLVKVGAPEAFCMVGRNVTGWRTSKMKD